MNRARAPEPFTNSVRVTSPSCKGSYASRTHRRISAREARESASVYLRLISARRLSADKGHERRSYFTRRRVSSIGLTIATANTRHAPFCGQRYLLFLPLRTPNRTEAAIFLRRRRASLRKNLHSVARLAPLEKNTGHVRSFHACERILSLTSLY
jgi:hypothetical protein